MLPSDAQLKADSDTDKASGGWKPGLLTSPGEGVRIGTEVAGAMAGTAARGLRMLGSCWGPGMLAKAWGLRPSLRAQQGLGWTHLGLGSGGGLEGKNRGREGGFGGWDEGQGENWGRNGDLEA